MRRKRPTAVLVLAIFHFILAACCGVAGVFQLAGGGELVKKLQPQENRPQVDFQKTLEQEVEKRFPAFQATQTADAAMTVLSGLLLAVAGVGLLNMQPWGRILSLVYAILAILRTAADVVIAVAFVLPAMDEALRALPGVPAEAARIGGLLGMLGGACIQVVYPIVVLVILLLPGIAAAFHAPPVPDSAVEAPEADEDDYERGGWGDRV